MATTAKTPQGRPKVLVVDDDDAFRNLLKEQLSDTFDVIDAANPEHGLGKVLKDHPDCILLDLFMPRYSGLELCQTLSTLSFTQLIPIIIMSGQSASSYKDFCMDLGARDFFEKPLNFPQLKDRIREILRPSDEERRAELRIRIRMNLVLRGFDIRGDYFEVRTSTENLSKTGFGCMAAVPLAMGAIVDVELLPDSNGMKGRAKVVHLEHRAKGLTMYGFEITEKTGEWAFQ